MLAMSGENHGEKPGQTQKRMVGGRDSNPLALFPKVILYQQIGLSLRRVVPKAIHVVVKND